MMTFKDIRRLVGEGRTQELSFQECHDSLNEQEYKELGPGSLTAGDAAKTFRLRRDAAKRSGKDVIGLDGVIRALEALSPDETVLLFHFSGKDKVFSIFVSAMGQLLGCVRVSRDASHPGDDHLL